MDSFAAYFKEPRTSCPNLTVLFSFAEIAWAASEDIVDKKSTPHKHLTMEEYNRMYRHVSKGQKIEARLNEILQTKENAVVIFIDAHENPLHEYMHDKNKDGIQRVTVISMGHKVHKEKIEAIKQEEAHGYFAIAGTIGSPIGFKKLHEILSTLKKDKKIKDATADMIVIQLGQEWETIPFLKNFPKIVKRTQRINSTHLTGRQKIDSIRLEQSLAWLSYNDLRLLFSDYEEWFMRQVHELLNPQGGTVFGEIPAALYSRVEGMMKPRELYTWVIPGILKFYGYAGDEETGHTFRLDIT